jgi:leucyl-tRNA synthetase
MFASPPEQTLEWSDAGVEGAHRFLRRVWAFAHAQSAAVASAPSIAIERRPLEAGAQDLRREIHTVLKQADYDFQRLQYNTVVSAGMKMLNALEGAKLPDAPASAATVRECLSILLRVLYPVVPHVTHRLWSELGFEAAHGDLLDAPWPQVDDAALVQDEIELVLQINGKVRGAVTVTATADKSAIEAAALASEPFARLSEGRAPKKVVVVPGRLVNVVV